MPPPFEAKPQSLWPVTTSIILRLYPGLQNQKNKQGAAKTAAAVVDSQPGDDSTEDQSDGMKPVTAAGIGAGAAGMSLLSPGAFLYWYRMC